MFKKTGLSQGRGNKRPKRLCSCFWWNISQLIMLTSKKSGCSAYEQIPRQFRKNVSLQKVGKNWGILSSTINKTIK